MTQKYSSCFFCQGYVSIPDTSDTTSEIQFDSKKLFVVHRWSELTRKLEFHVEVQELNESGTYAPVEVQPRPGIGTGGIFQLRQGQQRRIKAVVKPVQKSGMLPIICQSVVSISVGCPGTFLGLI